MRCTCCGRWTAEQITVQVPKYGPRPRIRVKSGPYLVGDYASAGEAAKVLGEAGVLDRMVEPPAPTSNTAATRAPASAES